MIIAALKTKIARSPLPEPKKAFFYNSLNKLSVFQKLKIKANKGQKEKMLEELNSSKVFSEREWLIEKANEL